jgi:hypothetical protein
MVGVISMSLAFGQTLIGTDFLVFYEGSYIGVLY